MFKVYFALSLLFFPFIIYAQSDSGDFKVAFYNVENLFDPANDSLTNDESFTPDGFNRWTYKRYYTKINNLGKVLLALGQGVPPEIVGVAEIENSKVLKDLCYNSPLKNHGYRFVHYDSPDSRGIEVALLYRSAMVEILHSEPIPIIFPFDPQSRNRDVLYAVAVVNKRDTLHLFVNHWTSRYGGYAPTIAKRNYYADVVRQKCDSIWDKNSVANILIMGDLNDYPTDESLQNHLQALCFSLPIDPRKLYNLMLSYSAFSNLGSHKHEDFWGCLDQFIVSGNLLLSSNPVWIKNNKAAIFKEEFMMENDKKYGGEKPLRTYLGPRYIGGYADHLPVYIELKIKN